MLRTSTVSPGRGYASVAAPASIARRRRASRARSARGRHPHPAGATRAGANIGGEGGSAGLPDDDRGAVGTDLRAHAAELAGVEAHSDDRVAALGLGLLHQPVDRLLPALREHRRHTAQLAADQRLQAGTQLRPDVAGADGQSEGLTEDLRDLVARELVPRRDEHAPEPTG